MKTTKLAVLLVLFSSLLLLSSCSGALNNDHQNFDLIASEKTLPANMHELAFEREETPHSRFLVRRADNQADFENFWNLYEFENQAPKLEFDEGSVFFIGLDESGSCPSKIGKAETNSDSVTLTIAIPDGNCTDDATARTFVIQIDKVKSKDLDSVIIVQSGIETRVPLEN